MGQEEVGAGGERTTSPLPTRKARTMTAGALIMTTGALIMTAGARTMTVRGRTTIGEEEEEIMTDILVEAVPTIGEALELAVMIVEETQAGE